MPQAATPGPLLLDALSLLSEVADDLVVKTVRDTHLAALDRVATVTRGTNPLHRGIAGAVYGGLSLGLSAASRASTRSRPTGVGPRLEDGVRGRFVSSAVNGLIGDKLLEERPQLAIPMAVRLRGRRRRRHAGRPGGGVPARRPGSSSSSCTACARTSPTSSATASGWARRTPRCSPGTGWTPLMLRANTGLPLRENGAALTALVQRVVDGWPVPVTRIALVGHSLGGLVIRAAGVVADEVDEPWRDRVTDVITLGTPHLGAPIAWGIGHGSRGLGRLPETAAFGRILDWRSQGVHDLVAGLAEDVPPLPHARYHLVAATLTASQRHPVGDVVGDLLVRPRSAYGRDRRGRELFPGADVLHVGRTDHFGLLNHPDVHAAMRRWLG